jgi:hydrogenase-4 component B
MAAITFVKLFGMVYLGTPRSQSAAPPHEIPGAMLLPMGIMACLCLMGGLAPALFLALVQPVVATLAPSAVSGAQIPASFALFPLFGLALIAGAAAVWLTVRKIIGHKGVAEDGTWGCGYLAPTPRMQYTGAAFSEFWASLTRSISRSITRKPVPVGIVPPAAAFSYQPEETLLENFIRPLLEMAGIGCAFLRRLQHGQLHLYVLYIFIALILLIAWVR